MKIIHSLAMCLALSGCQTAGKYLVDFEAPEKAAKAIDTYGREVPEFTRDNFRDAVNSQSEYCDIKVTCMGDSDE